MSTMKTYISEYIPKSSQQAIKFIEVNSDNFEKEIMIISRLIENYPNIAMVMFHNFILQDTEFPGIIYPYLSHPNETYYQNIKKNVDCLKLIQFGITLSNNEGLFPNETCTWQFNLNFDLRYTS